MRTMDSHLFSLSLTFVLQYVGSGYTDVVCRLSLYSLGLKMSLYLVHILYFVVIWIIIRLHQSKQAHSTTWQALRICKYQIIYIFPCWNLQNINMLSQWYFLYSTILCEMWLWKESPYAMMVNNSININNPPLTSKSLTKMKSTTHNVGNPGIGSGRAKTFFCWYKWHGWSSLCILSFHNIYNFCYLKNNLYKASECQHKIQEHCLILTYYV